jgi:hypothetical protein
VELTRGDNWIVCFPKFVSNSLLLYIVVTKENSIEFNISKKVCSNSRLHVFLSNLVQIKMQRNYIDINVLSL